MHDRRRLSHSCSFSSAAAPLPSPASSTSSRGYRVAASNKSSCESIPVVVPAELEKQASFSSSASSYESFFQLEEAYLNRVDPATAMTQAPPVQAMVVSGEQQQPAGYDPRRLPSSMFRTESTSPTDMVNWSFTSNDSLFSIQVPNSGELSSLYNDNSGDLYYDATGGGFRRIPSAAGAGHEEALWRLSSVSERLSGTPDTTAGAGGGLCASDGACARCSTAGRNRKSVRFASAAEIVSGESSHSDVFLTLADALGREAPATTEGEETKNPDTGTAGQWWCAFRCCWPSPPTVWWWPRCGCGGGGCGAFRCGEFCRC
ncbi:uncharacterized protein LOC102716503 [Oryza brachyantha]|uniref:Uncharacterized protein n=1 Tax=Oryza brachyantha TaxID=4533 RepID=J3M4P8_ORYBR|nr:uncharacterized protein LOC102716503 [Oryza brachyantha]